MATLGTHAIKVRLKGEGRFAFVTPGGGMNHLRIHAALWPEAQARETADHMIELNPDTVEAVRVVKFW